MPAFDRELRQSRATLEGILGEAPAAFSYPFNSYQPDDAAVTARYFGQAATVDARRIAPKTDPMWIPRFTWPGIPPNAFRWRRWLLTGRL
jgi:peptidoglycan/xylan/chitin deacetylase (PgdA/CDA1 family)